MSFFLEIPRVVGITNCGRLLASRLTTQALRMRIKWDFLKRLSLESDL